MVTVFQRHNDRETRNKKFDVIEIALMKSKIVQIMKTSVISESERVDLTKGRAMRRCPLPRQRSENAVTRQAMATQECSGASSALSSYHKALERNAQSFMKRAIAACIGLGDKHWDTVSLIGRLSWGRFASASVGDR